MPISLDIFPRGNNGIHRQTISLRSFQPSKIAHRGEAAQPQGLRSIDDRAAGEREARGLNAAIGPLGESKTSSIVPRRGGDWGRISLLGGFCWVPLGFCLGSIWVLAGSKNGRTERGNACLSTTCWVLPALRGGLRVRSAGAHARKSGLGAVCRCVWMPGVMVF